MSEIDERDQNLEGGGATHTVDVTAGVTATPVHDLSFPPDWKAGEPRLDVDESRPPTDPALRRQWERARSGDATPDETTDETDLDLVAVPRDLLDRLLNIRAGHPLGQTIWFRSRTGRWTAPAVITATLDSLYQPNVDGGHIPALSPDSVHCVNDTNGDGNCASCAHNPGAPCRQPVEGHVHLTVLTPGIQGQVSAETRETHPELTDPDRPNRPAGGSFQEWDIPRWDPQPEDITDSEGEPTFDFTVQPAGTWMWPL